MDDFIQWYVNLSPDEKDTINATLNVWFKGAQSFHHGMIGLLDREKVIFACQRRLLHRQNLGLEDCLEISKHLTQAIDTLKAQGVSST